MNIALPALKPNPNWASLPLFDRKGWKRVLFSDVVENCNETCNPVEAGLERFIAMEHLEPGSLHVRAWGKVADGTTFTRRCGPGQVLFGKRRAYQRKVAVAEFDAVVSGDIYVLAPKDDRLLPELLPFLCLSERFFQHAVGTSAGSLSPRTNWSSLASFEFDLPSLDQQRRIAEILWAVDEAEQSFAALVQSVGEARTAKFDGLIPWLSDVSHSVKFVRLDNVASMQNGRPFPSSEYQDATTPGVRLIRPGNLALDGRIGWAPKSTVTLPEKHRAENEGWFIGADQVLINLTAQSLDDGFMGRVCFTGEDDGGMLNQRIGRFVLDGSILSKFFFRCLQTSRFRQLVENRCEGSKVRHLYFRHFEDFMLPDFPKARQAEIVDELDTCEAALTSAIKQRDALSGVRSTLINTVLQ
ncbi:MAG: restriction endonuclease subunit S [Chthoniobacterales bacterium]